MLRRRRYVAPRRRHLATPVLFPALAAFLLVCCGRTPVGQKPSPVAAHGYTTVGNAILDSTGAVRVFHGVNRPSLEWRVDGDHMSAADFQLMHDQWKSDIVRIPLNQDFWLQGAAQYDAGYRATVDQAVRWALAAGLHVMLDLHWSDKGNLRGAPAAQQRMPDANSVTFWKQVAAVYKNETHVFFDLYNEPHDVSWDVWLNGGTVPDYTPAGGKTDSAFTAAGMQQLYDAVRSTGAENLVLVGGLDWGYDLSGVPQHRIAGHNIVYSTHPYEWKSDWQARAFFLAASDPIFMGEFGAAKCATKPYDDAIALADRNRVSWTAWAWWSGQPSQICGFPTILADWNGTPSVMGAVVKAALARYLPSGLLPLSTPAPSAGSAAH
ncbi:MAG TPA: glycoside hydrolase family 5 protein [Longimicrobiales bacterium]